MIWSRTVLDWNIDVLISSTNYKQKLRNGQDTREDQGQGQVQHQRIGFGVICCKKSLLVRFQTLVLWLYYKKLHREEKDIM